MTKINPRRPVSFRPVSDSKPKTRVQGLKGFWRGEVDGLFPTFSQNFNAVEDTPQP
jgi:hypothetical protein